MINIIKLYKCLHCAFMTIIVQIERNEFWNCFNVFAAGVEELFNEWVGSVRTDDRRLS